MSQKDIELILLRQWASLLATPIWIAGTDGGLLYYNEPAEAALGVRYDEAGEMPAERLATIFEIRDDDGNPIRSEDLALAIALTQRHPSHQRVRFRRFDGEWRRVDVTAFPIEAQGGRSLGAVAIFWEVEDH